LHIPVPARAFLDLDFVRTLLLGADLLSIQFLLFLRRSSVGGGIKCWRKGRILTLESPFLVLTPWRPTAEGK
jgi:hypothetical protein